MAERRRHAGSARQLRAYAAAREPHSAREPPALHVEPPALAIELRRYGNAELRARLVRPERREHARAEELQRRRDGHLETRVVVLVRGVLPAHVRGPEAADDASGLVGDDARHARGELK